MGDDTLYLVAHKVRGEPAFDVAIRCDDMGTASDPGPWWIIPTSGHRAYPFWHSDLFGLIDEGTGCSVMEGWLGHLCANIPEDVPDHYAACDRLPPEPSRLAELRSLIAPAKPQPNILRRPL